MIKLAIRLDKEAGVARAYFMPEKVTDLAHEDVIELATVNARMPEEVADLFKDFCVGALKAFLTKIMGDAGITVNVTKTIQLEPGQEPPPLEERVKYTGGETVH
jgi:hypothetical protein